MATLLLSRGVQGVEVVEAVAGVVNSDEGLRKLDGLLHFGLLEPHVRPPSCHATPRQFCLLFESLGRSIRLTSVLAVSISLCHW